ncbi:MAG: DNA polymerase III subunit alpha [Prevotellaceae bacterium]|nr:DNA polymerase III subunit alpha [Prevotellaceae bacterium]
MRDFVHLHVHTQYSLLDGQASIPRLVDKAIADGMRGMAVTDHGNMFGIKDFFDYCSKVNKQRRKEGLEPFKPIFGCEAYVCPRRKEDKSHEMGDDARYHLILLAKNETGYHNLIQLVSRSWTEGFYGKPRTDHDDLQRFHEGIIACSACLAGEVPHFLLKGDVQKAEETVLWYKSVFGDDYYLELQRHKVTDPQQRANRETFQLQEKVNKVIVELARKHGIKLVCTNDAHFVDEDNAEAHDILICLSTGKDLDDPKRMLYSKQEWLKTRAEMEEIFQDIPEALDNTMEVLSKVETYDLDSDPIMPFFPIPKDFGTEEQLRQRITESELRREFTSDEKGENPLPDEQAREKIRKMGGYEKLYRIKLEADYLAKLTREGAHRIYGDPLPEEVDERIRFELHVMKTMGFPGYFLIVQDFINAARNELGVWVGPGRGSAAGSVVAYCLGITRLDPLKYDLLFERFLNPDRVSLPDIDTDFDDDGRGKVLQWVMNKYGQENCAHIITYSTMATKNSIKDVARVLKYPFSKSTALCKAIPNRLSLGGKDLKMNLDNAILCTPELQAAQASNDPLEADVIKYARMLEGNIRGIGIHACGFIICRDPIACHVPVSTADDPDFPEQKTAVTQYDGHVIESTGLIKMDFLGLKTLSELKEACRLVKESKGVDIDLEHLPLDDELTYKLYQEGRTVGTFQFESSGMQLYLKELHPTVFEDLIAMNALYRPGPMDNIPSFIARKNGNEPITYDLPVMETYLKETYGITVYQEQVMLLSRLLAGFTRGESDALRKAMGKKKKDIVDAMKPKFIAGGTANGHDAKILEKIWSDWEKFASYAFNKSHAACYSWVAYQTAYIKAHYPEEFMAALLTRRKDDIKELSKLLEECKAMNIQVLGPDINESNMHASVNQKGQIRFGLAAIKGMGEQCSVSIVEERNKGGQFSSIYNLMERVPASALKRNSLESLALSGAFDSFTSPAIRREQYLTKDEQGLSFCEVLLRYGLQYQNAKQEAQFSLFGMEAVSINHPAPPEAEPWTELEKLNREKELVGIYLSAHPLDEYSFILNKICNLHTGQLADIGQLEAEQEVKIGGIVTAVKRGVGHKNNLPFCISTIEDFSEHAGEIKLFGQECAKWGSYMEVGNMLLISAKVQCRRFSETQKELRIVKVDFLNDVKDKIVERITVSMPLGNLNEDIALSLAQIAKESPGTVQLFFHFIDNDGLSHLQLKAKQKVTVSRKLVRFLEDNEQLTYTIN